MVPRASRAGRLDHGICTIARATGPTIIIARCSSPHRRPTAPGASVTVVNSDSAEHSVTADAGKAFDVDVDGKGTAT